MKALSKRLLKPNAAVVLLVAFSGAARVAQAQEPAPSKPNATAPQAPSKPNATAPQAPSRPNATAPQAPSRPNATAPQAPSKPNAVGAPSKPKPATAIQGPGTASVPAAAIPSVPVASDSEVHQAASTNNTTAAVNQPTGPAVAPASVPGEAAADEHGVRRQTHELRVVPQRYVLPQVTGGGTPLAPPAAPPGPPKERYPFGLELNFMPVWQTNPGFDLFSSNDIALRVGLSLDAELLEVANHTPLAVEIGWTTDAQRATSLFSRFDSEYSAQNFHGGLKLSHRVTSFLAPHVRLAAGASSVTTKFTAASDTNVRDFESHKWVAFGMLGAGVTATVPTRVAVRPALTIEGGYLVSGSVPLKLEPDPGASNSPALTTVGATMGSYGRSGPYLRIGVAIRY